MIRKVQKPKNPLGMIALLTWKQHFIFISSLMGWTLDSFDFFLVTFAIEDISKEFGRTVPEITGALTVTLMLRPLGAMIFGCLADKFGRKIPMLIDVFIFSLMCVLTGFSYNYASFMAFRAIFGIAMGGEWGLGAALAMESLPVETRGLFSGILQQGYSLGYLLSSLFYFAIYPSYGWRALFWFSSIPAVVCIVARCFVPESQNFKEKNKDKESKFGASFFKIVGKNWKTTIYCIILMSCMCFLAHGSQDLFPTFLKVQLKYSPSLTTICAVIANTGAVFGGITIGYLSEYFGRRRSLLLSCFLAGCFIPLWVLSEKSIYTLCTGVFIVQFFIMGAFGVIPAYLNELSPDNIRGTFPGTVYQLGNLITAATPQIQAKLADIYKVKDVPNYGIVQGVSVAIVIAICIITVCFGMENKGKDLINSDSKKLNIEAEKDVVDL